MPTVSVIIPLYNKQKHIARAVDSVMVQTWTDYELIIVDDGSTDKSIDIVRRYRDHRIRIISQDNTGPGAARNLGTAHSDAPLITYLDADDEWLPDFLAKTVSKLTDHPDCAAATTSFFIGSEKIERWQQLKKFEIKEGPWRLPLNIPQQKLNYSLAVFHTCCTLFRRSAVEKYGGFYSRDNCKYGEDVYLWLNIMFNHKIYRLAESLAWYHSEDSQLGLSSDKTDFPLEPCLTNIEPIRNNCPLEYRFVLERWLTNHALISALLHIELRNFEKTNYLLNSFPLIKKRRWQYLKLKTKLMFPELIPYVRSLKQFTKSSFKTASK